MTDPWSRFSSAQIAAATGCPEDAIAAHWPHIAYALDQLEIFQPFVQVAAIATTALETASTFRPIEEYRNADGSIPAYWYDYDGGPEYHGRGYIQLTHRYNYQTYGNLIGEDLASNPARALDPSVAAWVLAFYFQGRGVAAAALRQDWRETRRLVQGAYVGMDRYQAMVDALNDTPEPETPPDDCQAVREELAALTARYNALVARDVALADALAPVVNALNQPVLRAAQKAAARAQVWSVMDALREPT